MKRNIVTIQPIHWLAGGTGCHDGNPQTRWGRSEVKGAVMVKREFYQACLTDSHLSGASGVSGPMLYSWDKSELGPHYQKNETAVKMSFRQRMAGLSLIDGLRGSVIEKGLIYIKKRGSWGGLPI